MAFMLASGAVAQIAANCLSIAIFTPEDDNISLLDFFTMSKHCQFEWAGDGVRLPHFGGIKAASKHTSAPVIHTAGTARGQFAGYS